MAYNMQTKEYEGYIYLITNLVNNKIYVGQTRTTIEHRWGQHCSDYKKNNVTIVDRAIRKYGKENFSVNEICKITNKSKELMLKELNKKERFYIKTLRSLISEKGYNIDKGGSYSNYSMKPVDVYTLDGKLIESFDSCADASEHYGISRSGVCDVCNGITKKNKEINVVFRFKGDSFDKYNPFQTDKQYNVYKFTLDGELVGVYNNLQEASDSIENSNTYSSIAIGSVINGYCQTVYNYYWSKENIFDFDLESYRNRIKIDQYNIDGVLINEYESMTSALNNIGCRHEMCCQIKKSCTGKSYYPILGYIWRYHGEPFDKFPVKENKRTPKKIDQYDFNGNLLNTYDTISDGLVDNNIDLGYVSHVSKCCMGKKAYAKGYVWRFRGEPFDKYSHINAHCKPMNCYTLDDCFVETFDSSHEAAKFIDDDESKIHSKAGNIRICASGKRPSMFGYHWFYASDPNQPDKSRIIS